MSGAITQIVAVGAQDNFLIGAQEITFFKSMHKRHTPFAMESIQQTFNGTADFGRRVTCTIARSGDLVHEITLEVELPEITPAVSGRWNDDVGHHLIEYVELEIGSQRIDRHFGDWFQIWSALTVNTNKRSTYNRMIGKTNALCDFNRDV